uniref:Odorant receptor 19 n=1 Tax=Drosicha corpulenta TaxID=535978 RepID=A0A0U3SQ83_9HEMI|nr:odorant receptor 19 [Drosicha corpulenta]
MIEISRKFFKYGRIAIILFVSPLFAPAFAPLLQLTDDYSKYLYAPWYLPYVISDIRVYYLTYAFQTAIMLPSYILTSVAVIQPLYFWMVCRLQMFALTTILSNINERSVWDRVDHRPDEDIKSAISGLQTTDGYMFGYIQEVVEHHRSIIKLVKMFIRLYEKTLFYYIAFCCSTFSLNCYLIIVDKEALLSTTIERISYPIICYTSSLFYNLIGNFFTNMNSDFGEAVYDLNWYDQSLTFKKHVLLIVQTVSWTLQMEFTPNASLSLALYMSTIKASFSYLNFLLTVRKNG